MDEQSSTHRATDAFLQAMWDLVTQTGVSDCVKSATAILLLGVFYSLLPSAGEFLLLFCCEHTEMCLHVCTLKDPPYI